MNYFLAAGLVCFGFLFFLSFFWLLLPLPMMVSLFVNGGLSDVAL
jgi:hypothetical protein